MKLIKYWPVAAATVLLFVGTSCNSNNAKKDPAKETPVMQIKEEAVSYTLDTLTMNGYVAYDESTDKKRPVVLIVHEWWGLNDYAKSRAKQLAELGYL
ncbi:MAG TPA: dienelactone hydrolase family protein, partial [Ferruginibacter sp.]|nr:dienelactone hydrolase family protein [Ferruginibacter sp.]